MPNQDGPVAFWTFVCFFPACITTYVLYGYATSQDPHHSVISYMRHRSGGKEVPDVPIHPLHKVVHHKQLPKQFALFLYNSTMPHHMEFMHDVRVANWRHDINIYKHDCIKESAICGMVGHGNVHEYEPPILFYHDSEWSESYHDDIQQDKVARPTTRSERVAAVLKWLDQAAPSARDKLREREDMLNRLRGEGSPTQRYMKMMQEKAAKEEAEKEGVKAEL